LILDAPIADVGEVVAAATSAGDIDRHGPVGDGVEAREVNWGGRMGKGVVRALTDDEDGVPLLRTEAYIGSEGLANGMMRQARLVQGLARVLGSQVVGVRDISARADHDLAWLHGMAIGAVEQDDAITTAVGGTGTHWVHTFGAARFDVPDLEIYGLARAQVNGAIQAVNHVLTTLLTKGLKADLTLPDDTPVYLVPVLEAWQHLSLDWPGVGRAGKERGPGLDGPRATLSVLHPPRLGKYKKDFKGVLAALPMAA